MGGDLIVAIDGKPIKTFDEMLSYLIVNKGPGDVVMLTVMRGDQRMDISLTLGARPLIRCWLKRSSIRICS